MPFLLVWGAFASGSSFYKQFIVDRAVQQGEVTFRLPLVFSQLILALWCTAPLLITYPQLPLTLINIVAALSIGGLNYLASLFHQNLMIQEAGVAGELVKLPFNLHEYFRLQRYFIRFCNGLGLAFAGVYLVGLSLCLGYGAIVFPLSAALGVASSLIISKLPLPKEASSIMSYINFGLMLTATFGPTSLLAYGLFSGLIVYNIVFHLSKDTTQKKQNSYFPKADSKLNRHIVQLITSVDKLRENYDLLVKGNYHFTHEHIEESNELIKRLTNKNITPGREYSFEHYFNQIDFSDGKWVNEIDAEFTVQDSFYLHPKEYYQELYKLPQTASMGEIKRAYLADQIRQTDLKLKAKSLDLSYDKELLMKKHARLILEFIRDNWNSKRDDCERILLNIAFATGSHCSPIYETTFSELFINTLNQDDEQLSIKDSALLAITKLRTQHMHSIVNKVLEQMSPQDKNEFHTHQSIFDFIELLLSNTNNTNYSFDLVIPFMDTLLEAIINEIREEMNEWYNENYNVSMIVEELLSPQKAPQLHKLWMHWLDQKFPGVYQSLFIDISDDEEEDFNKTDDKEQIKIKLALLMLIDFDIIGTDKELSPMPQTP